MIEQFIPNFSRSTVVASPDLGRESRRSLVDGIMAFGTKSAPVSPGDEEGGGGRSRRFSRKISFSSKKGNPETNGEG